jgi:hypothetical protein
MVRPQAVAATDALAFGEATGAATRTFAVKNAALRGTLRTKALTITGANAGDFAVTGHTCDELPGNEQCEVTVRFDPKALGARTATLEMKTNDVVSRPISVALSGTGIVAAQPQAPAQTEPRVTLTQQQSAQPTARGTVQVAICGKKGKARKRCRTLTLAGVPRGMVRASLKRSGRTQAAATRRLSNQRLRIVLRTNGRGRHTLTLTKVGVKKPVAVRTLRVR